MTKRQSCPECNNVMMPVPNDEYGWMRQLRCIECHHVVEGVGVGS